MYVRLVVTFCNSEKVIKPKEAHIDYIEEAYYKVDDSTPIKTSNDVIERVLNNCMTILNEKYDKIEGMVPAHLKNKDFEIIIHGNYLQGIDWDSEHKQWSIPEPIFNIQQLGLPEKDRPIIKTS